MKILKLVIAIVSIFAANYVFATNASVSGISVGGYGSGTALFVVAGPNGSFVVDKAGVHGTLTSPGAVIPITSVALVAQAADSSSCESRCALTIPEGATATVSYSATRKKYSNGGYAGSASVTVGSITYTAITNDNPSYATSLSAGTYYLSASASAGTGDGGPLAQVSVNINYPASE